MPVRAFQIDYKNDKSCDERLNFVGESSSVAGMFVHERPSRWAKMKLGFMRLERKIVPFDGWLKFAPKIRCLACYKRRFHMWIIELDGFNFLYKSTSTCW